MRRLWQIIASVFVLVAVVPLDAPAGDGDDALSRAILRAQSAQSARVVTTDGAIVEGRITRSGGDGVDVRVTPGAVEQGVAAADIRSISLRRDRHKEARRIGSFLGGLVGSVLGFALGDANVTYLTVGGSVVGWGVGHTLERRFHSWRSIYPDGAGDGFRREGWFSSRTFSPAVLAASDGSGDVYLSGVTNLGRTLTPSAAVALEAGGWVDPGVVAFDFEDIDVFSTFTLCGYWIPDGGLVVGVGAGAAVGEHNAEREVDDASDWGWGATASVAYAVRVGRSTFVGPALSVDHLRLQGDYFDEVTFVTLGLRIVSW
jgi:hypothetical protein